MRNLKYEGYRNPFKTKLTKIKNTHQIKIDAETLSLTFNNQHVKMMDILV